MPDGDADAGQRPAGGSWPTTDLVRARADATPEREALVDAPTGESWTYRELDAWVERVAATLAGDDPLGGDRSDAAGPARIGVLSHPRPEVVALLHAAWRTGRELVPLSVQLPPADLADQLARADVDVLLADADARSLATDAVDDAATLADLVVRALEDLTRTETDASEPGATGRASYAVEGDDVPVTLMTSGSTGEPKAVRLTVGNLVSSATASAFRLGVARGDRWLSPLPTYHMGGIAPVVRCALYGSTVVLQREFDVDATADALAAHDATGVSLVPTALKRLLDADWRPDSSLRYVLLGGAAADADLLARCERAAVPVYPSYGMTETASQIATATPEQAFADPETVGQPLVNTTVHVVDAGGDAVSPGEVGELVVSGPTVTPGYLDAAADDADAGRNDAAADDADAGRDDAFSGRGFHTGDRGYRDADGKVYVTGRVDDMIVTGGENVQPAVVADALRALPAVADAAVVGLDDPEWGERVVALVVHDADADANAEKEAKRDAEAVRDAVSDALADHEVPKTVAFAASIPRTASGTVDRDAVRERVGED
ncbi:acyl--CoA ligase [Halorubellus sp. JP-L1]|uniref:class I adenylate-forming enzyme family protein n=1 Tax=Halorubellus sp. JP-L1 TaxID=2715753 RepID=UPI00140E0D5B|nr:class I adenylate-forming enzyme family protein [Halorubellus sp. JP-L1]NHN40457.1 acyl--CoA ligase [Halorubellus sp. JP-L1]